MSDEDGWAANAAKSRFDDGNIVGSSVEGVLRRDTFIAGGLERRNDFAEA
jgi:hypothetical protein